MVTRKLSDLLKTCIANKSLSRGKLAHQKIVSLGLQDNIVLSKSLINFYFSCHLYGSAELIFRTSGALRSSDVSLWNCLMAAYTKSSMFREALGLFEELLTDPCLKPDVYTYPNVLKACGELGRVGNGEAFHAQLVKAGCLSDVVIGSSAVSMYANCRRFRDAVRVFDEMGERDAACWNTVMSCCYQSGRPEKALELFERMKGSGVKPSLVTFTTAISSCSRLLDLERGKEIHGELVKCGLPLDGFVGSALVDMYGKCGELEKAKEIFEQMPEKTVISWNAMISGFSLIGDSSLCIGLLKRMNGEGIKPSLATLSSILTAASRSAQLQDGKFIHGYIIRNGVALDLFLDCSLIDFYFKCGRVASAENVFRKSGRMDVNSWNVMISGYASVGNYFEALEIFDEMKRVGGRPDAITFTSILSVCSQLASLEKGKEIHETIKESRFETNGIVMGALLEMYAKCGAVNEAHQVFERLQIKDLMSWTSMIAAYGSHGRARESLNLFAKMRAENIEPDKVTFLAVLSACSHGGLVDEGCYYFTQMITEYGIKPETEHYSCLVDLLGRAGRLREAYKIFHQIPDVSRDLGLLSSLFSACYYHRDIELGEEIARTVSKTDLDDPSTNVMLSNMYASVRRWDKVRQARSKMKELGLKKNPGCSWIEINQIIHPFLVEDKSHPMAQTLYDCLTVLSNHMENDEFEMLPHEIACEG
ncbi:hypothetical protein CDL15_Pgr025334 [Punica granatum]|uniref:Pentatricopeptide repeat-containing protein At5g27110 n=1 Tax=Punica granatum TaxID=22663 RepID=A0A218W8E4_PUNGR|nr:hypothetical protein CDL15_Pgr025334 [Punica granatum]